MAQHEANMAVQENESVNQLHVKIQEQRVAGFQAKAEVKRNMSRLETEPIGVNNQRETSVAEMNEMSHRYSVEVSEVQNRCAAHDHELALERANKPEPEPEMPESRTAMSRFRGQHRGQCTS